jgi:hypothetical protein
MLTVVDLERGLVGLEANGTFLSAEPDGRITLSKSWCSLWEFFLLSEDLAGAPVDAAGAKDHVYAVSRSTRNGCTPTSSTRDCACGSRRIPRPRNC